MKLLSMSGLVPEQICDVVRYTGYTGYTGERNIPHYCGYASDFISQVMYDEDFDGAVFPRSCDSSRIIKSYLSGSGKFLYQLNVPARQDKIAEEYFALEIEKYKKALEEHYQVSIDNLAERTEAINERNKKIRQIYENIDSVLYSSYLKHIHEMLQKPLAEQVVQVSFESRNKADYSGGGVFLIGSFLSNYRVAEMIENSGMGIVGDNLPESGRLASAPAVGLSGNLYKGIARSILKGRLSPSQNNFADILTRDMDKIKRKSVKGVIFILQKYCEPYEYLFSVYKKMLDSKGIPVLKLALSDSADDRNMLLAIEAFADII